MITCLLEILELPNFGHMTNLQHNLSRVIKFCWWRHGHKLWRDNLYFILRRFRVANFADIIKIMNIFIKTVFKDSKKVKRIRNYVPKCNLYLYFLISGE